MPCGSRPGGIFYTILVDNGSSDGSLELVKTRYPEVEIVSLPENLGFCRAVNEGIRKAEAEYVILLNNDTQVVFGLRGAAVPGDPLS